MKKVVFFRFLPIPFLVLFFLQCTFDLHNNPDTPAVTDERIFTDDTIAVSSLKWPTSDTTLPICSGSPVEDFSVPELPEPTGTIAISPSAFLQPIGVNERLSLAVYKAGTSIPDSTVTGTLSIDAGKQATVIKANAMQSGYAEAVVRFNSPGMHTISAELITTTDTLHGTVSLQTFTPQLPIMEMSIRENDFQTILDDPYEKIKVSAVLTCDGTQYPTEVRIHGGSSRDYPKKSFRFDLANDLEFPDTHDHIILRAEWNDKTMLRNYLCLELARRGTWLSVPNDEMVHFRINSRYYGVMWRVERIGGDFLRIRGCNNSTASMYEADPESECFTPGGNLTPLQSDADYRCVYSLQKGVLDYTDLIALIEEALLLPEEEFELKINDIVCVNDMLVYFAFMAIIQNHDHIKKNYYLYRDPDLTDDRWTIFPWDLELTLGHLWTESNDVLDETIFTDRPLSFGATTPPTNALFNRLYAIPVYQQRFDEMVSHLLETVFTESFINERIDNILCRASYDIIADQNKRADNNEYLRRVEEIKTFIRKRRSFIENN